ncbi:MAG: TonB family protein [Muribaculaceae bacterium]|nr:TonB family protein [Muribaculaceae bacterium]
MTATLLLIYSLISGAVLSLLWAVFRLAGINRLTCHRLNRLLLIAIMGASALLPAIAFIERPEPVLPVVDQNPEIAVAPITIQIDNWDEAPAPPAPGLGDRIVSMLPTLYMVGLAASALWLLIALGGVAAVIISGEKRRIDRHTTLIVHSRNITPFTWGRWIVISRADLDANADMLLCHEQAHRVARHWLDLLLARLLTCLDWYWPTAWLLSRDLAAVHEYQADSRVIGIGTEAAAYQMLLIRKGASGFFSNIANPFNYSSLKNRITMMQKKQSSARSRMRCLLMLPAAALAIFLAASPALASAVKSALPAKPETPAEAAAPAPVIAAPVPVIEAPDGTELVSDKTESPAGTNVKYYLAEIVEESDSINYKYTLGYYLRGLNHDPNLPQPLLVIDGVADPNAGLNTALDNTKVLLVEINKTSDAVEKYGEAAKNGVIEVISIHAPEEMQAAAREKLAKSKSLTAADAVQVRTRQVAVNPADTAELTKQAPTFPGGERALYSKMARSIRYPAEAAQNNIQGQVIVQFRVLPDGSMDSVRVARGADPLLDAEAVRVVKTLGKFNPGTQNGEPVAMWYTMPISFKLQGDSSESTGDSNAQVTRLGGNIQSVKGDRITGATFPGGEAAMMKFLADNIKYPAEAVKAKAEGTVHLGVYIDEKGQITEVKVNDNKSGNAALAQEAIRVVKTMPAFTPASADGQPVKFYLNLPVVFKLK